MFELDLSANDMFCIKKEKPTPTEREVLRSVVCCNWIDNPDYQVSKAAGAFLQCDYPDFIMVEFWRPDGAESFIEHVNHRLQEEEALLAGCANLQ